MTPRPYFNEKRQVLPFDKVIELEKIDGLTYRSVIKAYSPTRGENGTYGGHVYAQAAWAAAQTIAEGLVIHNITGFFLLGGKPTEHFTYTVQKIRDGYNYSTRTVVATQNAGTPMFTCTCSFKREEASPFAFQETVNLKERYASVLNGELEHEPMLHPNAPSMDSDKFREDYLPAHPEHFNPVAGLHLRKADMKSYNERKGPGEKRQLTFYSLRGELPNATSPHPPPSSNAGGKMGVRREANMHACAHLYASDRNSLYIIPNHLERGRDYTRLASLSHTVIFHVGARDMIMTPEPRIYHPNTDTTLWDEGPITLCNLGGAVDGKTDADGRKWFVQEAAVTRAEGGRGLHVSRLWDYERGVHIATTVQDGLVRFRAGTKL